MQTRRKSQTCSKAKDDIWLGFMDHIDKRFAEFKQKDLKGHYNLLKNWRSTLDETRQWYSQSIDRFQAVVDGINCQTSTAMKDGDDEVQLEGPLLSGAIEQGDADLHCAVACDHTYSRSLGSNVIRPYVPHECGSQCFMDVLLQQLNVSPLQTPLLMGWQRLVLKGLNADLQLEAVYVAPCGRKLRSLDEVRHYLDVTQALYLKGLHFTFDPHCELLSAPYNLKDVVAYLDDISEGREKTPISCVNAFSDDLPEKFDYISRCSYEPGVLSVTPTDFQVCCDCSDNCVDRSKCACWQLTLQEAGLVRNSDFSVGYVHHRLKRSQLSAVYECHPGCGCGERCSNRVVQDGVRHRLQVYHTGHPQLQWAVRTLDDIPEGTFVCSYLGHIYKEVDADNVAKDHGDEYFADLDYMEVVERHKANYEHTVDSQLVDTSTSSCGYRFAHKNSEGSSNMSSSVLGNRSRSSTPGESVMSGCGSSAFTNFSKLSSLSPGPLSRGTSPLSSLSSPMFASSEETSLRAPTQPLTQTSTSLSSKSAPPTCKSTPPGSSSSAHLTGSDYQSTRTNLPLSLSSHELKHSRNSSDSTSPSPPCKYRKTESQSMNLSSPELTRPLLDSTSSLKLLNPNDVMGSTSSNGVSLDSTSLVKVSHPPNAVGTTLSPELPRHSCSKLVKVPTEKTAKATPTDSTAETTPTYLSLFPVSSPASFCTDLSSPTASPESPPSNSIKSVTHPLAMSDKTNAADPLPCPLFLALSPGHTPPPSPHNDDLSLSRSPHRHLSSPSLRSISKGSQTMSPDHTTPATSPLLFIPLSTESSPQPSPSDQSPSQQPPSSSLSSDLHCTSIPEAPAGRSLSSKSRSPNISPSHSNLPSLSNSPSLIISPGSSPPLSPSCTEQQMKAFISTLLPPAGRTGSMDATKPADGCSSVGSLTVDSTKHCNPECPSTDGNHYQTRRFFHEEFVYFMDAKRKGNVGRFLNHSCSPNLFVQNVFVDSHDLRFPWVAFFAARKISAMEELTWDYNYVVGSVEDKVIMCLCGATNCRKRLL